MDSLGMVKVKVFSGNVNDLAKFMARCEVAGLRNRKSDMMMNLTGQIRVEDVETLRRVHGVAKVEVLPNEP